MILDTKTFITRLEKLNAAVTRDMHITQQSDGPCQVIDRATQIATDISTLLKNFSKVSGHETIDLNAVCSGIKLEETMRILKDLPPPNEENGTFVMFL